MKVAVVGAAGKMGSWFTTYFIRRGFAVSAFDVKSIDIKGVTNSPTLHECLQDADLVLVSVPVQKTPEVIGKCAKAMKKGSHLAEISSVKSKTLPALRRAGGRLSVLCIHPMFGPGADDTKALKMLLVPVINKKAEHLAAQQLFAGISISTIKDARTHDKSIAAVLGLTYFINVAFAEIMAKEDLKVLKKVGGTTFSVQTVLAESVMNDEPELAAALLRDNPYAHGYMVRYLGAAQQLVQTRKIELVLKKIKKDVERQSDLQRSYRRLYMMLKDGNIT